MDIEENTASDDLSNFVTTELEKLEAQIEQLDQAMEDLTTRLGAMQIQRKRYDSLRGHYHGVLNRKEILGSEDVLESSSPEQRDPWTMESVSQASGPLSSSMTGPEFEISLSERDYVVSSVHGRGSIVRGKGDTIAAAVFEILKDRENLDLEDRPVHYRHLVQEIEDRGIYVSGRDPGLNMVAHIHKDERFHRPKRGFYGLTEWYPASARQAGERTPRRNARR